MLVEAHLRFNRGHLLRACISKLLILENVHGEVLSMSIILNVPANARH
jgi:hypothetical protein